MIPKLIIAMAALTALAGCGSSGTPLSTDQSATTTGKTSTQTTANAPVIAGTADYNPKIDPAEFTDEVTNPYFPLKPGAVLILDGVKDGVPQRHETTITTQTKRIIGVDCVVVNDVVTSNGALVEKTSDWYAQDAKGSVWYFGEASADYENGVVVSTDGSWEAGVDGAEPGIIMPADPKPGPAFYTEFRPGVAEDRAKVLKVGETLTNRSGDYKNVVEIRDTNPLDPTLVQHKWYAPGVGLVESVRTGSSHTERSQLVKYTG